MASVVEHPGPGARTSAVRRFWRRITRNLASFMPQGLYARSLIIIIAPMILLQTIVAAVFMERHWQRVTELLSAGVARDVAALVSIVETYPQPLQDGISPVERIARNDMELSVSILQGDALPPPRRKAFFSVLDEALSDQLRRSLDNPFWVEAIGESRLLEIRVKLKPQEGVEPRILRVFAKRSRAYASNTHIFMVWMVGASIVLLAIAILFLRNQIKPIQRLAEAAESFGKGQRFERFRPRGAREVRQAARSFNEMRARIERQIEQRTAMLAGVSHDLKTVLTRFRLQLALSPQSDETAAMERDVSDMQRMLDGYLDFARGDAAELASDVDLREMLARLESDAALKGRDLSTSLEGDAIVLVRPNAFRRLVDNIVGNALRYGETVRVSVEHGRRSLAVIVEDDGPGVPPRHREDVFRAFHRLDEARNMDESGNGLGLSIARDIARSHGGDIVLGDSDMGGLKASIRLPV